MSMPLRQQLAVGSYIMSKKLKGEKKYPLVLELEPLLQCNLACAGCGKIAHPNEILRKRLSVEECIAAVEECGAPIVSIAGGEPLVHEHMPQIVQALVDRKKFVFLCTNALLLEKKIEQYTPSPYFAWMIHMDGLKERHDESVCREGVFDKAVAAIKVAKERGFRVFTNTTFFNKDDASSIRAVLDYLNDDLKVDSMQISPAYAYEKAPDQEHFLGVDETRKVFREAFAGGARGRWRLNHSPVYLDFLEGKVDFECTPWGIPCYTVFGWQRPCYLMSDAPYAKTYKELIEETDWEKYGRGKHPSCANCMAHCGYEPTAVLRTTGSLKESIRAALGR
ncbi:MAG: adenosyl-hopene transferase HpnH [Candidatus Eremiobacteraeota bacterium]|nr:adenosyl-hopene transferase HpnH [Candidatus Eremiobacteraeota bacterium]